MKTGLFIALLNPSIALVLGTAFFLLWSYQRQRRYLAALALANVASAVGFLLQYFVLPFGLGATKFIANASFMAAGVCVASAVIVLHGRKVPYLALGVLVTGGMAGFSWFMFVEPDLMWRIYSVNFALGGVSLLVMAELRAVPNKGAVDKIMLGLAFLAGLNFLARPLAIFSVTGPYQTYDGFYDSPYWTTAMLSHALMSLLIAFTLITTAVLDLFRTLRSDSHTDPLSGLLNRRGFEEAAAVALRQSAELRLPAALIIADLDHFKAVNDTFGHAVGDRVISAFAALLRAAAGKNGIAGRLGGEEFAILLPASDLSAARLFAEGVRTSFAKGKIGDVPERARVTASFGVATPSHGENLSALLDRADKALYQAKTHGRDRVRISYQLPPDDPPHTADLRSA